MPSIVNLSLSNIINVTVLGAQTGLSLPIINTAALFSTEAPLSSLGADYKIYKSATDVITDFGSGSKAAAIATAFFAQNPNVLTTGGYLVIVPMVTSPTAETVLEAIARTMDQVYYFGVLLDQVLAATPFGNLATYVQTLDKVWFAYSTTAADIDSSGLFDDVRTASQTHTRCVMHLGSATLAMTMAAAYAGRSLSTAFDGSNTTQTMHMKSLAGITGDTAMTQTLLNKAIAAGCDVYPNIASTAMVFSTGANQFFDEIYNELWFKMALQVAGYNYLRQTNSKVPQTEVGMDGLKNAYRQVCDQAVRCGFLGRGSWTSADSFGDREALFRCISDVGYYIYSSPVSTQATADRNARKAPLIQIAAKSAGAIHSSDVIVSVNL